MTSSDQICINSSNINSSFIIYHSPINYVYCANNLVMFVDIDGIKIAFADNAKELVQVSLPAEMNDYVAFDDNYRRKLSDNESFSSLYSPDLRYPVMREIKKCEDAINGRLK